METIINIEYPIENLSSIKYETEKEKFIEKINKRDRDYKNLLKQREKIFNEKREIERKKEREYHDLNPYYFMYYLSNPYNFQVQINGKRLF